MTAEAEKAVTVVGKTRPEVEYQKVVESDLLLADWLEMLKKLMIVLALGLVVLPVAQVGLFLLVEGSKMDFLAWVISICFYRFSLEVYTNYNTINTIIIQIYLQQFSLIQIIF